MKVHFDDLQLLESPFLEENLFRTNLKIKFWHWWRLSLPTFRDASHWRN